jgi:2-C-methyl-D-erythritol 2,4-cyclodiphosphate synthase
MNVAGTYPEFRIGQGIDLHEFCEGESLVLGGVSISSPRGLKGHSDADVLTHAVMDALLGAAGQRDIGYFFPPSEEQWRGARSIGLLDEVVQIISRHGWKVGNVDVSLVLEEPKISPFIDEMKENLALACQIDASRVSVKATTAESLGAIGRKEGAFASAVALIVRLPEQ